MRNSVFFNGKGEGEVALTSTSANHIANLAKEYIQTIESSLNNVCFFKTEVALIGGDNNVIQEGWKPEWLGEVTPALQNVALSKSLIAWLREGIKAKEALMKELENLSFEQWCKDNNVEAPVSPDYGHVLTKDEYYDSLPIKERNRYYQLETEAAVIGSYIHPSGSLSNAREELKNRIQHPHKVDGKGRDALIYTYTPTVDKDVVDTLFFELQKKHREVQAQLNAMKHSCEQAINESTQKVNTEYNAATLEYKAKLKELIGLYKEYKDNKSKEYRELKIIIPNSLLGIYNTINSLGK